MTDIIAGASAQRRFEQINRWPELLTDRELVMVCKTQRLLRYMALIRYIQLREWRVFGVVQT
jgi:hypothetical protein